MTSWRRKQSAANPSRPADSLLTGKNTGYFYDSEPGKQLHRADRHVNWAYLVEFPTKRNSVFFSKIRVRKIRIRDWKTMASDYNPS
ncbi:MAG: hypothetical protein QOF14_4434 [Hyphomicrobiales bacterium]|jgi:hypothetical protein|nr:hypothetical protein [Hyphomicrobiales bacterium]